MLMRYGRCASAGICLNAGANIASQAGCLAQRHGTPVLEQVPAKNIIASIPGDNTGARFVRTARRTDHSIPSFRTDLP
jgi:hypothetical protein